MDQQTRNLFQAVMDDDVEAARQAIDGGADVNANCIFGWEGDTGGNLHLTNVSDDDFWGIHDNDLREGYGCTPLNYATLNENLTMVDLLIAANADVNKLDAVGCGPVYYAIAEGSSLEISRRLLELGADVNAKSTDGSSALSAFSGWLGLRTGQTTTEAAMRQYFGCVQRPLLKLVVTV